MESQVVWTAALAALVVFVVVQVAVAVWLKRSLVRELASSGEYGGSAHYAAGSRSSAERFADVAPELVTLARTAANAAIRNEEVHEWHQLDLFPLGSDDISEAIRDRVRHASFDAVAARSGLSVGLRRHAAVIPAPLEADLRAFVGHLDQGEGGTRAERRRRIVAGLDAVEARIREALDADARD